MAQDRPLGRPGGLPALRLHPPPRRLGPLLRVPVERGGGAPRTAPPVPILMEVADEASRGRENFAAHTQARTERIRTGGSRSVRSHSTSSCSAHARQPHSVNGCAEGATICTGCKPRQRDLSSRYATHAQSLLPPLPPQPLRPTPRRFRGRRRRTGARRRAAPSRPQSPGRAAPAWPPPPRKTRPVQTPAPTQPGGARDRQRDRVHERGHVPLLRAPRPEDMEGPAAHPAPRQIGRRCNLLDDSSAAVVVAAAANQRCQVVAPVALQLCRRKSWDSTDMGGWPWSHRRKGRGRIAGERAPVAPRCGGRPAAGRPPPPIAVVVPAITNHHLQRYIRSPDILQHDGWCRVFFQYRQRHELQRPLPLAAPHGQPHHRGFRESSTGMRWFTHFMPSQLTRVRKEIRPARNLVVRRRPREREHAHGRPSTGRGPPPSAPSGPATTEQRACLRAAALRFRAPTTPDAPGIRTGGGELATPWRPGASPTPCEEGTGPEGAAGCDAVRMPGRPGGGGGAGEDAGAAGRG
eukprot:CAMPEP_0194265268 /NCGR_PEP_ID=MMETSP0169-20130528/573_1 /TAXON_ID=218684 /ORGANISM="Corethron pennatum, Strain L29A3" /LENGTH=520 /DNA_ID=CAMNT_0039005701 /DNA_START=216 /DNA_END=1777 /DNA_ORIENTATION=-